MNRSTDSLPRQRVDNAAKALFLAALRDGAHRDSAAAATGFSDQAFYDARRKDAVFALAWRFAHDLSAADQRAAARAVSPGELVIAPNRGRALQARPARRVRFDDRRKRIFLDHFAGTADAHAAAAAAGIAYSTFTEHRRRDAAFAAGCDEALAVAYAALEAEVVRQSLAAQRDLRAGIVPKGAITGNFDRALKLLARYERTCGPPGFRAVAPGGERRWRFEEAIVLLDRHVRAFAARHDIPIEPIALSAPDDAGRNAA